jgi:hypothetical protein
MNDYTTQTWIERSHMDVLRTLCYQPGPLNPPDLGELSMEAPERVEAVH